MALDYNEVFQFMKDFGIDLLTKKSELIIDEETNTYVTIKNCKDIEEVKLYVVYSLCRPIGKGLEGNDALRLLEKLNTYFQVNLTRSDLRLMYSKLCSPSQLEEFKDFINRGFPIEELAI